MCAVQAIELLVTHYSNNKKLIHEGDEEKMQAVSVWGGQDKSGLDILDIPFLKKLYLLN